MDALKIDPAAALLSAKFIAGAILMAFVVICGEQVEWPKRRRKK